MRSPAGFSRGSLDPKDPARALRLRRDRLVERALQTQRRLGPRPPAALAGRAAS